MNKNNSQPKQSNSPYLDAARRGNSLESQRLQCGEEQPAVHKDQFPSLENSNGSVGEPTLFMNNDIYINLKKLDGLVDRKCSDHIYKKMPGTEEKIPDRKHSNVNGTSDENSSTHNNTKVKKMNGTEAAKCFGHHRSSKDDVERLNSTTITNGNSNNVNQLRFATIAYKVKDVDSDGTTTLEIISKTDHKNDKLASNKTSKYANLSHQEIERKLLETELSLAKCARKLEKEVNLRSERERAFNIPIDDIPIINIRYSSRWNKYYQPRTNHNRIDNKPMYQDIYDFIEAFELAFEVHNTDIDLHWNRALYLTFSYSANEDTRTWYEFQMNIKKADFKSWKEMKDRLIKDFSEFTVHDYKRQLYMLRQDFGEPISKYLNRYLTLMKKADSQDNHFLACVWFFGLQECCQKFLELRIKMLRLCNQDEWPQDVVFLHRNETIKSLWCTIEQKIISIEKEMLSVWKNEFDRLQQQEEQSSSVCSNSGGRSRNNNKKRNRKIYRDNSNIQPNNGNKRRRNDSVSPHY